MYTNFSLSSLSPDFSFVTDERAVLLSPTYKGLISKAPHILVVSERPSSRSCRFWRKNFLNNRTGEWASLATDLNVGTKNSIL